MAAGSAGATHLGVAAFAGSAVLSPAAVRGAAARATLQGVGAVFAAGTVPVVGTVTLAETVAGTVTLFDATAGSVALSEEAAT